MPTRFFTNDSTNTLLKKFKGIFDLNPDLAHFDALVGYLRASGYFAIRPKLKDIPKVRILVGIDVDEITEELAVEKEKAKKRPPSAYCRVPREIAKECKIFCAWDVLSSKEEDAEKLILSQKQAQQKYLTTCTANLNNFKREQTQVEADINQLRKNIGDINEKVTTLQEKRKELQKPFTSIGLYIDELEKFIKKLADLRSREKTLKSKWRMQKSSKRNFKKDTSKQKTNLSMNMLGRLLRSLEERKLSLNATSLVKK